MAALHPAIPRVLCPDCGELLALHRIRPDRQDKPVIEFRCDCGFDYRLHARHGRDELAL
jgi:RNase P subunit RPR2